MIPVLAWRNLWRNPARSLITMSSVFFAVLLATSARSLNEGTYDRMIENVAAVHTGYIQVHAAGYWDDKNLDNTFAPERDLLERIRALPGVRRTAPRLESFALASTGNVTTPAMVIGADPEAEHALSGLGDDLEAGEYLLPGGRDILVAQGLARRLNLAPGDSLVLLGQGYRAVSAAGLYAVGGIVRFGSPELNDRVIYMPLEEAQRFYGAEGRLTSLVVNPPDRRAVTRVLEALRAMLDKEFEAMAWNEMLPALVQAIALDRAGGYIMFAVLYMVIAFGIFGTLLMMTFERKQEFGVLLSVGMRRERLAAMVFLESVALAALGVAAGLAGSLPLVLYFAHNPIRLTGSWAEAYREFGIEPILHVSTDPSVFLGQGMLILAVASVIALFPVYRAFRINPVEAMKR